MSGAKMNYNKYYNNLREMEPPVMPSDIPEVQVRLRDMATYAREKGCKVSELTEEEKRLFIDD